MEPLRDRAGTGCGTELEAGGVGGGRRAANTMASWPSLGRGGTARRWRAGDEGNVGTGQRKGVVVPSSIPLGQLEGCPQLLEIPGSGAGEEWEMGAVGLHPLPLTLHPVTRSPAGWWAVGAGPCHAGAGYGPFGRQSCAGAAVAPYPGCQVPAVPCAPATPNQSLGIAVLPPKCIGCVRHQRPRERGSGGGSALTGSPQVSQPGRLPMPPASWHFTLRWLYLPLMRGGALSLLPGSHLVPAPGPGPSPHG